MRILFQYFTGGGGALSNVLLLLRALARSYPEDQLIIVCSDKSDLITLKDLSNIEVIVYGRTGISELDRLWLGYWGLRKISQRKKVDVVWSLNLGAYTSLDCLSILSIHNPHQVYPWRVTRYHPGNRLRVGLLRWFFRKSLRCSDAIIVQTPVIGQYVSEIAGAPASINVVPKAVENSEDVAARPLSAKLLDLLAQASEPRRFTFLYVATCMPHKNHRTLIDAFDLLAQRGIAARVFLTLESKQLIEIGGAKAKHLIDNGHLVPVGWTDKIFLRSLYDAADACLMPSVLESLSSAHLEAMQWGKPQIVADLPYARDLCGDAAIYVSAEDAEAWADMITNFIADAPTQEDLVAKGYYRMRQFPATWSDVAAQIHKVLEKAVAEHPGKYR